MRDVILAGFVFSILSVSSDASGDTRCDEDRPMIDCVEMLVNRLATFERAYFSDRDSTSREMDGLREELRELREEQAAFPVGAIVAVRGRCPSGWDEYEDARGRVLVGANDRFALGESGGSRNIRIERENLPSITLRLPTWRSHGGGGAIQHKLTNILRDFHIMQLLMRMHWEIIRSIREERKYWAKGEQYHTCLHTGLFVTAFELK